MNEREREKNREWRENINYIKSHKKLEPVEKIEKKRNKKERFFFRGFIK
jgi:hypothetical protein